MSSSQSTSIAQPFVLKRHLFLVLSLVMGLVAGLGILSTTFNTSVGELLSENDPYLDELVEMDEKFPTAMTITFAVTGIESQDEPGTVFNQASLSALRNLDALYSDLPGATRLSSILAYRSPQSNFVLFERNSQDYSESELAEMAQTALSDPLLANTFLLANGAVTFATVFIEMDQANQSARLQLAEEVLGLTENLRASNPDVGIYVNSDVLFELSTQDAMIQDLTTLLPIVILICVLTICYCFHSITFGACILVQALLSVISTVGIVGFTGTGFNTISVIAPLIVVIISVAHSVHIISVYKQQLFQDISYEDAMTASIGYNVKPVLLATVTTAIGFLSLNLSSSPAIQDFGRIVATGIGFAFVYTFTLLPALLIWISKRTKAHGKTMDSVLPNRLVHWIKPFWQKHDKSLFIGCTALAVITLMMLPLNETDFDRLDFIETDSESGKYYEAISTSLQRGPVLEYAIALEQIDGAVEPEFLLKVDEFSTWLTELEEIDNAASLVDVVKTIEQAQNRRDPAYYVIPDEADDVILGLNVYATIELDDFPLARFIDNDFSTLKLLINTRPLTNQQLIDLDAEITAGFDQQFAGIDARLIHGSGIVVFARMDGLITIELMQGYSLSLLLITLTLIIGFRSVYFGLLSVIPNLLPATIVFGSWGLFVGQLDPFVMMLFSISIGLVVDDTVHLLTHYLDARKQGKPINDAFNQSLDTAGPALIVTTAVLALGTTILIGASTLYFHQAAKLLVPIVVLALVLDLIYLPTILRRFDKKFFSSKPKTVAS
jgi:predicted RND superfamily exporter protein